MTSPGFCAEPLGMFSDDGIAAITLIFGLSSAIARIVARIDAAPPMSHFIVSMPEGSFGARPPESNATPLPVSAMGVALPAPMYRSSIMRGGFTDPFPTPRIPPNPPCASWFSFHTLQVRPTALAIRCASRAISAGGMSPAGVLTRSRAQRTDAATIPPAFAPSFAAFASHRGGTSTVHSRNAVSSEEDLYRSKRYRPSSTASIAACTASAAWRAPKARAKVVATDGKRRVDAAARPRMRRIAVRSRPPFCPAPTTKTFRASNASPSRRATRRSSPFLPWSRAAPYAPASPTSFSPGPTSPSVNAGTIRRSAATSRADSVDVRNLVTDPPRWRALAATVTVTDAGQCSGGGGSHAARYAEAGMKTRNVTDLVYFDEESGRTEVLYETEQLFSQVICLQEAQGIGPVSDATSEGLLVVLSGEVSAQIGRTRARMKQWSSATVPAGDELTVRNASADPSVVLLVLAPPPG